MLWQWVLGAGLMAVVGICVLQYRNANARHVPLSSRQPVRRPSGTRDVPLGHEGLEMEGVLRTQRRHQGLERTAGFTGMFGGGKNAPDLIDPEGLSLPDDETYSARYHAAFHNRRNKDRSQ